MRRYNLHLPDDIEERAAKLIDKERAAREALGVGGRVTARTVLRSAVLLGLQVLERAEEPHVISEPPDDWPKDADGRPLSYREVQRVMHERWEAELKEARRG